VRIAEVTPLTDYRLHIVTVDGQDAHFDVKPYLGYDAFVPLLQLENFADIRNGGYFVEWACGADLSADTIEARMVSVTTVTV
jgi:hypothetical protein